MPNRTAIRLQRRIHFFCGIVFLLVFFYVLMIFNISQNKNIGLTSVNPGVFTTLSPSVAPKAMSPHNPSHNTSDAPYVGDDTDETFEVIEKAELVKEDLERMPFPFNVGYSVFAGLLLHSFTTSGSAVAPWEREALAYHLRNLGQLNETRWYAREVYPRLITGDSINAPLNVLTYADRYYVKQIPNNVYRKSLCDNFVRLMEVEGMPPLVVKMYTLAAPTFVLRCLYHRGKELGNAKREFVLLTPEGDNTAAQGYFWGGEFSKYPGGNISFLLSHPLLKHWYSVNGNVRHPKFTSIPIGARFFHVSRGHSMLPPSELTLGKYRYFEAEHRVHMKFFLKNFDLNKLFPHITHKLTLGRNGCTWLEDALDIFADTAIEPDIQWVPLERLPNRVKVVYIVLIPLDAKQSMRPSLTSEVLIFKEESPAAAHVALLPFTAAVYHKVLQNPYGHPNRKTQVVTAFRVYTWREEMYYYMRNHTEMAYFPSANAEGKQASFYDAANEYAFVLSPLGFGYDCFRTWEALLLGAIPIVQHPAPFTGKVLAVGKEDELTYGSEVNQLGLIDVFADLPVIILNSSSEITMDNLEKWKGEIYEKMQQGKYRLEKLFMQYWVDQIYKRSI